MYIHADIHGASSVIVKNSGDGPIPPLSLQQAALMTISRSSAWESKILTTCALHHWTALLWNDACWMCVDVDLNSECFFFVLLRLP